jgi:glycosyltransferase involved in cell wall biosynthesis
MSEVEQGLPPVAGLRGAPSPEAVVELARPAADERLADLAELAAASGLLRVRAVAWRDLEDPEAGGSESHTHEILRRLAACGLDVTLRTSAVDGLPPSVWRDGYRVDRRHGRYAVFPQVAAELARGRHDTAGGLIEMWNGMPFLTPLWAPSVPRVVVVHHVHAEMWRMIFPRALALLGETFECRVAPRAYRRTRVLTSSRSAGEEIESMLGIPADRVTVLQVGVDERFSPGGPRSRHPLVVSVSRLVPVKRLDLLIESVVALRTTHPELEAVIVGEGYERPALEAQVRRAGAAGFISLPGRLSADQLLDLYRRAWVLVSTSAREGWGMTVTEAGACGTPAVATRIVGHVDSVVDGVTGLLAEPGEDFVATLGTVLSDEVLRRRLGTAAATRAASFSWDATARTVLEALAEEAQAVRRRRR